MNVFDLLSDKLKQSVQELGFSSPTPVQAEVIPKIISKNKTNLQINLRQNSSAANNMNETTISTNTNAYVDNNGTLSIAVLSAEAENNQILILIKPKINYVDNN